MNKRRLLANRRTILYSIGSADIIFNLLLLLIVGFGRPSQFTISMSNVPVAPNDRTHPAPERNNYIRVDENRVFHFSAPGYSDSLHLPAQKVEGSAAILKQGSEIRMKTRQFVDYLSRDSISGAKPSIEIDINPGIPAHDLLQIWVSLADVEVESRLIFYDLGATGDVPSAGME